MNKKTYKKIIGIAISAVVIGTTFLLEEFSGVEIQKYINEYLYLSQSNEDIKGYKNTDGNFYDIVRVVDGDTFIINYNGKDERVRLIGIDTPESVHPNEEKNTEFGKQVSNYSKEMLGGNKVELEFDVEERDKYGRLLVYVYLDGQMYNKLLLEKGYAKIATYPPNVKYVEDFTKIQKQARENKVGLWGY